MDIINKDRQKAVELPLMSKVRLVYPVNTATNIYISRFQICHVQYSISAFANPQVVSRVIGHAHYDSRIHQMNSRRPNIDIQFTVKSAESMARAINNPELLDRYPIYEKAFTHFSQKIMTLRIGRKEGFTNPTVRDYPLWCPEWNEVSTVERDAICVVKVQDVGGKTGWDTRGGSRMICADQCWCGITAKFGDWYNLLPV